MQGFGCILGFMLLRFPAFRASHCFSCSPAFSYFFTFLLFPLLCFFVSFFLVSLLFSLLWPFLPLRLSTSVLLLQSYVLLLAALLLYAPLILCFFDFLASFLYSLFMLLCLSCYFSLSSFWVCPYLLAVELWCF